MYLISLAYMGKTMHRDVCSKEPVVRNSSNAVYRFLRNTSINWTRFLLTVGGNIVCELDKLTDEDRRSALIFDDTPYVRSGSKKTELVSKFYDHVDGRYKRGFRTLFMAWSDGASLIPLAFRHMSSSNPENRLSDVRPDQDKRTCSYKAKMEAIQSMPTVVIRMLEDAKRRCIPANYVLFDSWFSFPSLILDVCSLGYHVVARLKKMPKVFYEIGGERKTLKQIFDTSKKRRGKSRYLLCAEVTVASDGKTSVPARIVYVRNKANRKDWIAIISTDMDLPIDDIVAEYGKRWGIEVFFKTCKSYLRLTGEFQQTYYEALTAHTAIVALRYMILAVEQRRSTDPRTIGGMFYEYGDGIKDVSFDDVMLVIMDSLFAIVNNDSIDLDKAQIDALMDAFITELPKALTQLLRQDFSPKTAWF
jgi:hypothetical protein